jgi:hypothetical protein
MTRTSRQTDLEQSTPEKKTCMKNRRNYIAASTAIRQQGGLVAALLQQIHDDLRIQHPEWVQPNGESPTCDSYEARLMKLLDRGAKGLR